MGGGDQGTSEKFQGQLNWNTQQAAELYGIFFSSIVYCLLEQLHIGLAFGPKAQAHFCIG